LDPDAATDAGLSLRLELDESNGDVRVLRLIADRNELAMLGVTAGLRAINRDSFDGDERPMPMLQPLEDITEWSLAYIPRSVGAEAAATLIEPFFPVAAEGEPTTVAEFALLLRDNAFGVFELQASDDSVFIDDFGRVVPVEFEGAELVVRTSADFDGSGVIDSQDLVTFVRAFGTNAPELDLNGDGRLDRIDFVEMLNMEGLPAVELRPIGGQPTAFGVAAANAIVNARVNAANGQVASGELGAPEARQRGVIDPRRSGLAAGMGRAPAEGRPTFTSELAELDRELIDHIPIPGPRKGQEPTTPPRVDRLTPVAGAWIVDQLGLSELRVGFDQDVTIPQGSVRLWGTRSLQDVAFTSTYDTEVRTLTLTPAAPLRNDRYTLLVDYTVTNAADLALDGEIPQPLAANLPSGDGTEGGQAVFQFNVLQGDATRDGVVDMADRDVLLASLGRSEGDPGFNALADLNADGVVNVLDVNILQTNFGQTLGTPDGTPPTVDGRTPAPGTTLRALTLDTVEVTFSEPIEPDHLSRRSLHAVTPAGELRVPDSVALAPDGRVATFTFAGSLANLGLYDFRLSNGVSDPSGELLDLTLWTAALDNAPARLIFSSPFNGEDDVAVTRETIVEFDQSLDRASVSPSAVFGQFGGASLPAMLYQSQAGNRVTLFYSDNLPASARVRVTVDGDQLIDDLGLAADADGDGVPGGIRTLDFDTLSLTEITGTAVCGRVFASELDDDGVTSVDVPLAGVTITVDGREDELFAVTDEMGNFRLEPAPVGRFFVHIDGRTATNADIPEGAYYPFVGKVFKSVAGQETSPKGEPIATAGKGEIYLPLVAPDALEPVSQTEDTVVGFPQSVIDSFADQPDFQQALLGTSITVPADSLFADDGTRGGQVGIAPVPRDRLPGPLPDGLNIPLVITVQTDGPTNFDVPVPAVFPNLPDPVTGEVVPPGEQSTLWSFDHDLGRWIVNGTLTASADGLTLRSDAGFGIRAPGWHGAAGGAAIQGRMSFWELTCYGAGECNYRTLGRNAATVALGALTAGNSGRVREAFGLSADLTTSGAAVIESIIENRELSPAERIGLAKVGLDRVLQGYGSVLRQLNVSDQRRVASHIGNLRRQLNLSNQDLPMVRARNNAARDRLIQGAGVGRRILRLVGFVGYLNDVRELGISYRACLCINARQLNVSEADIDQALADIENAIVQIADAEVGLFDSLSALLDPALEARLQDQSNDVLLLPIDLSGEPGIRCIDAGTGALLMNRLTGERAEFTIEELLDAQLFESIDTLQPVLVSMIDSMMAVADVTADMAESFENIDCVAVGLAATTRSELESQQISSTPSGGAFFVLQPLTGTSAPESRGRISASGEFNELVSSAGPVAISAYDPVNRAIGTIFWQAGSAGFGATPFYGAPPRSTPSGNSPDGCANCGRSAAAPFASCDLGSVVSRTPFDGLPLVLTPDDAPDSDSDGLSDDAEFIIGTNPESSDTDEDGVPDGAEVDDGTNPLDGLIVETGVVATANTPGAATDVASFGNRSVIADGSAGVSVFNVFLGLNPILVAQVDTPGEATAVAFTGNLVAVADGSAGLTVLDVTDPPAATILHRVAAADLRGSARAVTTAGNIALVGTSGGTIATVDMVTGAVLDTIVVGPSIQDLAIDGRYAYALTDGTLRSYDFTTGRPVLIDSVDVQTGVPGSALGERSRLSVGGGFAYCSHRQGFSVVDVSDPFTMVRQSVSGELTSQFGWKQLRPNGSGLGIAAVSPNSGFGGPNDVSLYDLEAVVAEGQSISDSFLATFETPGVARAVSIFNGLAYVADNDRGLQVVNYREFDGDGIAPTAAFTVTEFGRRSADLDGNGMLDTTDMALLVDLIASGDLRSDLNGDGQADSADLMLLMDLIDSGEPDPAIDGLVEDGQLLVVEAEVFDDVQVRNVELLIDGEVVQTDGNFPFQFFVNAPTFASPDGTDDPMPFEITVRASDTGGNRTTADPQPLRVQPDRTAPRVLSTEPQQGQEIFDGFFDFFTTGGISLRFSESVILSSDSEISLTAAGADGLFDTSDDTALAFSASSLARETLLVVRPSGMLPVGDVRLYIQDGAIRDSADNPLDSNSDGAGGGPFVLEFPVVERPSVFWSFEGSGFWDEATKWSSGSVPTSADEVRIDVPGSETITHRSGNSQMFAVVASDAVSVAGGSLGVLERAQFNQLLLSSGDLGGTGSIDLSGPFTWTGGTLSGTGVLTAADGATLGGSAKTADRPVILGGQSVWSSGEITGNASPVRVPAGAELTVLADSVFRSSVSATKRLVNEGTIRHSGSGTTAFSRPIGNGGNGVLDNRGTVVIESGEIEHQVPGGRNAGTITVQSGAVLDLRQSFT
ncbi:MAG: Ig-like domain-containing protein, partial [Planctomycetota bacterium]